MSTPNTVVFDLEWNQSSFQPNLRMPHEIIEIGACRVDENCAVTDTFSRIIRPALYKKLDKHIRQVTGITEEELEQGCAFAEAFADFVVWCGEDVQLVTWGRDDYPVLKRNAIFFETGMPFSPPVDAQMVFGFTRMGDAHRQVNLHNALEMMQLDPQVPAHRAVYDAQCTAALLPCVKAGAEALCEEKREQLRRLLLREKRIADSTLRSIPTRYAYQSDAVKNQKLMQLPCPVCGAGTSVDTPWFDIGRDRYICVTLCRSHGLIAGQMHFKRAPSGLLILHQRAALTDDLEADDTRRRYAEFLLIPPKKRHHRLSAPDDNKQDDPQAETRTAQPNTASPKSV